MSFSPHLLLPAPYYRKCVPSLKKLTRNLWRLHISIWVYIFTWSFKVPSNSLFNTKIWKSKQHLASCTSVSFWVLRDLVCWNLYPLYFQFSIWSLLSKVTLSGSHSGKFEINEKPCPSPCNSPPPQRPSQPGSRQSPKVLVTIYSPDPPFFSICTATVLVQAFVCSPLDHAVASTWISRPLVLNAFPCSLSILHTAARMIF